MRSLLHLMVRVISQALESAVLLACAHTTMAWMDTGRSNPLIPPLNGQHLSPSLKQNSAFYVYLRLHGSFTSLESHPIDFDINTRFLRLRPTNSGLCLSSLYLCLPTAQTRSADAGASNVALTLSSHTRKEPSPTRKQQRLCQDCENSVKKGQNYISPAIIVIRRLRTNHRTTT